MAKLSEKEKALLESLQAKAEAPDAPAIGRSISAHVDLGDEKQVALAIKHGFLTADEVEELNEGEGDDTGKEGNETPTRRGYFGDK